MSKPSREFFLLLPNAQVVACGREAPSAFQLEDAVAWCEDGGPWLPPGADGATPPKLVPWRCEHYFCPRPVRSGPCPWWIDSAHLVHCLLTSSPHAGPSLFEGEPHDPPMVLKSCRIQAATPIRLASGLMLEPTS